ncbi:hypothetical protein GN956_G24680 [Arapaima gigas]
MTAGPEAYCSSSFAPCAPPWGSGTRRAGKKVGLQCVRQTGQLTGDIPVTCIPGHGVCSLLLHFCHVTQNSGYDQPREQGGQAVSDAGHHGVPEREEYLDCSIYPDLSENRKEGKTTVKVKRRHRASCQLTAPAWCRPGDRRSYKMCHIRKGR